MANVITEIETRVNTTTTTYSIYDSTADHSTSHASTSHVHTLSGCSISSGNNGNYVQGSYNTTNNSATTDFSVYSGGYGALIYAGFKNNVALSVPAQGALASNLHIATVSGNAKPKQNIRLFGNIYRNNYQFNTDGKIYLMSLNGTGAARTIAKSNMNEGFVGTYILAAPPASFYKTSQPTT